MTSDCDSPFCGFDDTSKTHSSKAVDSDSSLSSDEDFHDASCAVATSEIPLKDALSGADCNEWMQAVCEEFRSLISNNTWELMNKPTGAKIIGRKTFLRNKYDGDGKMIRRKARVVAQGSSQRPGVEFEETFAPVTRIESLRMLAALAVQFDLEISQLDIVTAYFNGNIDAEIYMKTPALREEYLAEMGRTEKDSHLKSKIENMIETLSQGEKMCKLRKALYGLRQAGRLSHAKFSHTLMEIGMHPTNADPCVYVDSSPNERTYLLLYVDDILIASNPKRVKEIRERLGKDFEVKEIGKVNYCLGIEVHQSSGKFPLSQRGFVQRILTRFGMVDCKLVRTPI